MKQKNVLSSVNNSQVKNLIVLQKKAKERASQGVFIIEGIKMFEEAKEAGDLIKKAYIAESFYDGIIHKNPDYFKGFDFEVVTDSVFKEISDTKTPQGVLATVQVANYSLDGILKTPNTCLLLLEDIRDPGNLGTMIRTAEGAGITGVILNNSCVDLYNPKVIRSTMGSIFRVPFFVSKDFIGDLSLIKEEGIQVFAAHLKGKSYDTEGSFIGRSALLIGNEANGLSKEVSTMADTLIRIPMEGKVESLNAAVAAAILMYEAARQRRKK